MTKAVSAPDVYKRQVQGPGSPTDFCKRVEAMSNGRLKIQHFAAGELIPALEGFDAVSSLSLIHI